MAARAAVPELLRRASETRPPLRAAQRQRRLSQEDAAELVAARQGGETLDSLARTFGIHRTTVMAIVRRAQPIPEYRDTLRRCSSTDQR